MHTLFCFCFCSFVCFFFLFLIQGICIYFPLSLFSFSSFRSQFKCYLLLLHCLEQNRSQQKLKKKIQLDHSTCFCSALCASKQTFVYRLCVYARTEIKFKMKRGRQERYSRKEQAWRNHSFDSDFSIIYLCDLTKTLHEDLDL